MKIVRTAELQAAYGEPPLPRRSMAANLVRLRHRYWPDHVIGEILAKRWMETAIPVLLLVIVVLSFSAAIPDYLSLGSLSDLSRQAGEIGFVVLGLT
ncbi:MAG: hypothetical protein ACREDP_18585, partial [Bradyrhizobium sp.]